MIEESQKSLRKGQRQIEGYAGLVLVVPTRNRAALAMNAVNSVLAQPNCEVSVLVSDNSTEAEQSDQLSSFCAQFDDERVRYVRPHKSLSMTEHYDWAMRQALDLYELSHFSLLTDRMVFKADQLANIIRVAASFPNKLVSYAHDRVVDYSLPVFLEQQRWTDGVFEIPTQQLLVLSSKLVLHESLPRMLNCVAPREVLEAVWQHYGNIFDSIAPDFNFCYRFLEMYDSFIYYDRAALIHYALDRSNGEAQARGIPSKDHLDFIANLGGKQFNTAAPIPQIMTVGNAIVHEYCHVKAETKSRKFPEVDFEAYLQYLGREVEEILNPELKQEMKAVLMSHGWRGAATAKSPTLAAKLLSPSRISGKLWWMMGSDHARPLWSVMSYLGIQMPCGNRFKFNNAEEAIDYANKYPRRRSSDTEHLKSLRPVKVETGGVAREERATG